MAPKKKPVSLKRQRPAAPDADDGEEDDEALPPIALTRSQRAEQWVDEFEMVTRTERSCSDPPAKPVKDVSIEQLKFGTTTGETPNLALLHMFKRTGSATRPPLKRLEITPPNGALNPLVKCTFEEKEGKTTVQRSVTMPVRELQGEPAFSEMVKEHVGLAEHAKRRGLALTELSKDKISLDVLFNNAMEQRPPTRPARKKRETEEETKHILL